MEHLKKDYFCNYSSRKSDCTGWHLAAACERGLQGASEIRLFYVATAFVNQTIFPPAVPPGSCR
jgi:hypothetical protein